MLLHSFTNMHILYTGSSRGDGIYEATDADTALLVGSDNVATSNLQLNDTKESHGIILRC